LKVSPPHSGALATWVADCRVPPGGTVNPGPLHGLMLSQVLRGTFAFSVLAAVMPAAAGLYLCFTLDPPSAATIVLAAFVSLYLALPVSRLRVV